MHTIDLRSDTVTQPTPEMRRAIFEADLGDDVYGEDNTVNRLQRMTADRLGMDEALFVASGTMGNLISVLAHCARGEEIILGDLSHIFVNEAGGISALGGVFPHTIPNQPDGTLKLDDIENAIRSENIHFPHTHLLSLENTHNRCYGAALTPQYTADAVALARRHGILVHLDGSRIFNAAAALNVDARKLVEGVDSVNVCLSKGLCAPVGSVICGSSAFITRARRIRKMVGGGMRQAGIIAAAGIAALEKMTERLSEDHENARFFANGILAIPGLATEPERVATNIVYIDLLDRKLSDDDFLDKLLAMGIKLSHTGPARFRMVSHHGITREDIEKALAAIDTLMKQAH